MAMIAVLTYSLNSASNDPERAARLRAGAAKSQAQIRLDSDLSRAVESGNIAEVTALLKEGANPQTTTWLDDSSLTKAALGGEVAMVNALLEAGAGHADGVPLLVAARDGHVAVVNALLEAGADHADGWPLYMAAQWGHVAVVRALLKAGADPRKLVEKKLDVHPIPGWLTWWLEWLFLFGRRSLAREIQRNPSRWVEWDESPLHVASRNGHGAVVRILMDA
jgi:hypothetical protein